MRFDEPPLYAAGEALRTPSEGWGYHRGSPDLRRLIALGQIALESADAEFRPLQIGQDSDGTADIAFHLANDLVALADILMIPVAHVQAEDIGSGFMKRADHRIRA